MDVRDVVSTEFESVDVDDRVSTLQGIFEDSDVRAVVVTDGGAYEGLVTRRQLASSHVDPDARVGRYVWHVARVEPHDDVRKVAGRMVGSATSVLPVFRDDDLCGVVTAEAILEKVRPYLGVLTVDDVYTRGLVTVGPKSAVGEALHLFREHGVSHLPVVTRRDPQGPPARRERAEPAMDLVGVLGLHDVFRFTAREMRRERGGSPGEFGDDRSGGGPGSHGGYGERGGGLERMLDVPVENLMTDVILTTTTEEPLDEAVGAMLDEGVSSLVVTAGAGPVGIVTKTDVLEALTVTGEEHIPVQIMNIDLLDDLTRAEVAEMIEAVAAKYDRMSVLEANVYLHKHDEKLRGVPLILARIRLFTDRGHFVGTGEGYGAAHALRLARNILERDILEGKDYARTKKHPRPEELSKMYGWWLSGSPRRR